MSQGFRRVYHRKKARPPDRRNPDPDRTHDPLLVLRKGRDRPREMTPKGKGFVLARPQLTQQCLRHFNDDPRKRAFLCSADLGR